MKGKTNIQRRLSVLLLVVTLGVVLYMGFSGNDIHELSIALQNLSPAYLLICLAGWGVYVLMDALAIHHFLHLQGYTIKLRKSLHSAILGIFYCNITPGASGGQPMQMYYLSRYNVPIGISGSGMAVKFVIFQAVLLVTGAGLWLAHWEFVRLYAFGHRWFVLLGYVANFFSIGMVLLMAISKRAVRGVIERCIRIGEKLRICKEPERSRAKWENHCTSFLESVQLILRKPGDVLVQCLIAFVQLMALMVVILAVYHALGLMGIRNIELVTMGVLLYIGASYTPLPGASGAQEGGFAVLFSSIFPEARLFVALMIWRFSTYYLSILVGSAVSVVDNVCRLRKEEKSGKSMSETGQ